MINSKQNISDIKIPVKILPNLKKIYESIQNFRNAKKYFKILKENELSNEKKINKQLADSTSGTLSCRFSKITVG